MPPKLVHALPKSAFFLTIDTNSHVKTSHFDSRQKLRLFSEGKKLSNQKKILLNLFYG